jgi:hypothetical protein
MASAVDGDRAVDLACQAQRPDRSRRYPTTLQQSRYGCSKRLKPGIWILLRPTRTRERKVVGSGCFRDHSSVAVNEYTLEALRAHVASDHVCHGVSS